MIELSKPIILRDGTLVPNGVRLTFTNGTGKYQGKPVDRTLIPLQAIKNSSGPFLNASCAIVLNDNKRFQEKFGKTYKDWAHVIPWYDYLIVYIWDTREVIDLIPGLHEGAKGGDVNRNLVSKTNGEKITQTLGHNKWGWSKGIYEMLMLPQYHRNDNGLPLVTKNAEWKETIDKFNTHIVSKFAYESYVFGPGNEAYNEEKLSKRAYQLLPTIIKRAENKEYKHNIVVNNVMAFLFEFTHNGGNLSKANSTDFFKWYESK